MDVLNTRRLLLRPSSPCDRDELHRLEQDPDVMRYLNGGEPTPLVPPAGGAGFFMPRGAESGLWCVIIRDTGHFAGWVDLGDDDGDDQLGYRFARTHWGNGYATEAVAAVLADAFERQGRATVAAVTAVANTRSRRVLERSGMLLQRIDHPQPSPRIPGGEAGIAVYRVERATWNRPRKSKQLRQADR